MTTPDRREERLRARLASYGDALDDAAAGSPAAKLRRHLIVVDGPVGGGRAGRRPPPWRGPVGRVAAVVVVLAALAGATWAATRPSDTATTARTERGWADDDIVRPEDRPSAFGALDGTWPLPAGASLEFVLDRPTDASQSFAGFRQMLAYNASCLWFRRVVEGPDLSADDRAAVAAMPGWPGHVEVEPGSAQEILQGLVDAALAGDIETLRRHITVNCDGSAQGLGLTDLGGGWLIAGGSTSSDGAAAPDGTAASIEPSRIRGWEAIVERLGPDLQVDGAVGFADGGYHVALSGPVAFSLTIELLDGSVTLPLTDEDFGRAHERRDDGREVFFGAIGDDDALAQVVGPGGASVSLSFRSSPESVEEILGDVADLALDLHDAAWPR